MSYWYFSVNMQGLFLWKIKKGITITNAFQKILNESKQKPKKKYGLIKAANFIIMKSWLERNNIEMYSMHDEGKSVVVERL